MIAAARADDDDNVGNSSACDSLFTTFVARCSFHTQFSIHDKFRVNM